MNHLAAPRHVKLMNAAVRLQLKCGCYIRCGQLRLTDPDESVRKIAQAKLLVVVEQHMADKHFERPNDEVSG